MRFVSRTLYTIIAIVLCSHLIWGDSLNDTTQVLSLDHLSYKQLAREFLAKPSDDERLVIAYHYLDRAVIEKDFEQIGEAYLLLAQTYDGTDLAIVYANKAIAATQDEKLKSFPCKGYIELAKQYYYKNDLTKALKLYIFADSLNKYLANEYLNLKIKHGFGVISLQNRELEKAKNIFLQNYKYFGDIDMIQNYPREYLTTVMGISQYYIRSDSIEIGLKYVNSGINMSLYLGLIEQYYTLVVYSGYCLNRLEDYTAAIDSIDKILYKNIYFKQTIAGAYRTTIKAHSQICKIDPALKYLEELEVLCQNYPELNKYLSSAYAAVGDLYKNLGNSKLELLFRNKQIRLDSMTTLFALEEVRKLEQLQSKLFLDSSTSSVFNYTAYEIVVVICFSLLICIYGGTFFYKKREDIGEVADLEKREASKEISEEVRCFLLKKLNTFEKKNGYLEKSCSLSSLAFDFNSNTLYLSRVINIEKQKNFRKYINDLRITYLLSDLNFLEIYTQYTLKAIAEECGFKNVRSFTKAFIGKTDQAPADYFNTNKDKNHFVK